MKDDMTTPAARELVPVRTVAPGLAIHIEGVPERGPGREGVVERGRGPMSFDAIVASHEARTTLLTVVSRHGRGMVMAHYVTGVHPDSLVRVHPKDWVDGPDVLSEVKGTLVMSELRGGPAWHATAPLVLGGLLPDGLPPIAVREGDVITVEGADGLSVGTYVIESMVVDAEGWGVRLVLGDLPTGPGL